MANKYLDYNGTQYFWGKLKDYFQAKLVSGTNIKTINNESILGSGNISVSGGSTVLFNSSSKVSSGTITLADDYTNYDFLHVSYLCNVDAFSALFDCAKMASDPTKNYQGAISVMDGNTTFASSCRFSVTDGTHLSVAHVGNNANFVAGIVKIMGITFTTCNHRGIKTA